MNQEKLFRRASMRLKGYDYASPGFYYVTICTKGREWLFGEIKLESMLPNAGGNAVIQCWHDIPQHFPNVRLHSFVLMPNHIHGILEITRKIHSLGEAIDRAQNVEPLQVTGRDRNMECNFEKRNRYQYIIPRSLGSIIRGFEIGVTKWFRENTQVQTVWQRNFNESILRSKKAIRNVSKYIDDNPKNWTRDPFNKSTW